MAATPQKRTILLAVDGGKTAEHAFDWYCQFIHQPGNELVVVHSLEAPDVQVHPFMGLKEELMLEEYKKQGEKEVQVKAVYEAKLAERQIPGRYIGKPGKAGPTIVKAAKEENVDFIVIGTRGHGVIGRAFLGSVSHYVLHHAHCPVTIIHKEKEGHH